MHATRQPKPCQAATAIVAVFQGKAAPVVFGDLAAEGKANARSSRLGREERDKQVSGVRQAWPVVLDANLEKCGRCDPTDPDPSPGFQRCIHGVMQQVDEQLFQLVAVGLNYQRRAWLRTIAIRFSSLTTRSSHSLTTTGRTEGRGNLANRA